MKIYKDLINKFGLKEETIFIISILLVAAYFRLNSLNYMEFKFDEAFASNQALQFSRGYEFPLVGLKSSMGAFNPPIFIYLLALPMLITSNPIFATGFIALLNIAAVFLCYIFTKILFGRKTALMASLLYAVNPWAVLFSRKIWAQDMLPLFVILFMFSLWKLVEGNNLKYIIPMFIFLTILLQLHMSAIAFIFFLLIILLMNRPLLPVKKLTIGVLILLILFLPYGVFELRNNFYNTKQFLDYTKKESHFTPQSITVPFTLATTKGFGYSLGNSYSEFTKEITNLDFSNLLALISLIGGTLYLIFNKGKRFLALWLLLPSLFLIFSKSGIEPHYFIPTFPVQFIIMANGLNVGDEWIQNKVANKVAKRSISYLMIMIFISIFISQALFTFNFQAFIKNKIRIDGDYGVPYQYRVEALREFMKSRDPRDWPIDLTNDYIVKYVLLKE